MQTIRFFICTILTIIALQSTAGAQAHDVRVLAGWAWFDDNDDHVLAGASFQTRVAGGLRIGPEVLLLSSFGDDRDVSIAAIMSYEFGPSAIRPYVVGGLGVLHHRQDSFLSAVRTSNRATYGVGAGLKLGLPGRFFIAPEVRLGWEPFVRGSIGIGYRF